MSDDYTIVKVDIGVDKFTNSYEAKQYVTYKMLHGIENYVIPFGIGMCKTFNEAKEKVEKQIEIYKKDNTPYNYFENLK